jgi:hypothetical protein
VTSVEQVGEQSRAQHHRYYGLFGADPANGDGFNELNTSIREIGEQAADIQAWLAGSGFTSAADEGLLAALRDDQSTFGAAAAIAAAAAAVADSSAQLNLSGAAAIAAHMQGEMSQLSVIPDKASPDGVLHALATIDNHQAKSLSAVEHFASAAQDLGQLAQMASPHPDPVPAQLTQMSDSRHLAGIAQPAPTSGLEQLSQPLAQLPSQQLDSAPTPPTVVGDGQQNRSAPSEHDHTVTITDVRPPA